MPSDIYGRDSALPDLTASAADHRAALREPDRHEPLAARRLRVGRLRRRPHVAARRLRAVLQHQQPAEPDRHGHQPAGTPRPVIANPTFPNPPFDRAGGDLDPAGAVGPREPARARLERQRAARALVATPSVTLGYAGSRGMHLLRSNDVNTATPTSRCRRHAVLPGRHAAPEHGVLDHRAEEQRRRLLVQRAASSKCAAAGATGFIVPVVVHVLEERGHDAGLDVLLRRDQRHDVGASRSSSPTTTRGCRTSTRGTTGW